MTAPQVSATGCAAIWKAAVSKKSVSEWRGSIVLSPLLLLLYWYKCDAKPTFTSFSFFCTPTLSAEPLGFTLGALLSRRCHPHAQVTIKMYRIRVLFECDRKIQWKLKISPTPEKSELSGYYLTGFISIIEHVQPRQLEDLYLTIKPKIGQ